jgi:hypothetical protein
MSKNSKSESAVLSLNYSIMFMQNFSSPAFTQADFLTIFQVNFRFFLRNSQKFPNLKKVSNRKSQKAFFTKIWAIYHFYKNFKIESWVCSRDPKISKLCLYRAQMMKDSRNVKFVVLKAAEISSIQISSIKIRRRRVTHGFFLALNLHFEHFLMIFFFIL